MNDRPLTDEEVFDLGYVPTARGWHPRRDHAPSTPTLIDTIAEVIEGRSELPESIAEIEALRSAALRVLEETDGDDRERAATLRALYEAAQKAVLRDWAIEAMDQVIAEHFDLEPPPPRGSWEGECRRLRRLGCSACPACRRDLPSDGVLDRVDQLRRDYLHTQARRHRVAT